MTPGNKELLLKDLCARLLYGVKIQIKDTASAVPSDEVLDFALMHFIDSIFNRIPKRTGRSPKIDIEILKPYLRPMSSMTEEEEEKYNSLNAYEGGIFPHTEEAFDWLNEHHFDYRGLIPMGLALEAPEGMYKF